MLAESDACNVESYTRLTEPVSDPVSAFGVISPITPLAVAGVASAADKDAKDTKAAKVEAKVETKAENKAEDKIDINRASADELRKIDGIGEARSAAIIKGRPYRSKDELVSKNIIPKAVYDKIKERIIAKQ